MHKLSCLIIILLSLSVAPVHGQTQSDTLQYDIGLNMSGRKISGTFTQVVAGGGLTFDFLYKNWHLENNTTYRYNKTNDRLIEDNWYDLAILKYYPNANEKLYPGIFYHFDNNLIFRVHSRHNYGVGLGSNLSKGAMKLSILGGIAHENARYNGADFVNSDLDVSHRKNGLFLFRVDNEYHIAKNNINLFYQIFYFQSFKESADYDIRFNTRMSFKVYKGLSLFVMYNYHFENVHLASQSKYNDIIAYGVNWRIRG